MLRQIYNLTGGQGNPSYLTDILPGGAGGNAVAGTTPVPFIGSPAVEPFDLGVNDYTPGAPAIAGKLLVLSPNISGGAGYARSQAPAAALPFGAYGIVSSPGLNDGISIPPQAQIRQLGPIQAYCTTANNAPISVGSFLVADGLGNLTAPATFVGTAPTNGSTVIVTAEGVQGTSSYSYEIGAIANDGSTSALSAAGTTALGNSILTSVNYNLITATAGSGDVVNYAVVRSAVPAGSGYATGIIGYTPNIATGGGVSDHGQAVLGQFQASNTTVQLVSAGTCLAVSLGTLAGDTTTPTLVPVIVGGF